MSRHSGIIPRARMEEHAVMLMLTGKHRCNVGYDVGYDVHMQVHCCGKDERLRKDHKMSSVSL